MAEKEKNVSEAASKQPKPKKEKKKGKVKDAWKGFKSELKKIVWPSWKQVLKNSLLVIVVVVICALAIGLFDFTLNKGFSALIDLVKDWFVK